MNLADRGGRRGASLGQNPPMTRPPTRFAWNGDVSLAYQVCGDGPTDLLYLQGYCSNVDVNWDGAHLARFLSGLAAHARLVITDRRGWGCSERFSPGDVPDVDTLTDDVLAVMKAAGSDRASILATYECAIVALLFAATYPERTRSLVLVDPQVTYLPTDEIPWMPTLAQWHTVVAGADGMVEGSTETLARAPADQRVKSTGCSV